MYVTFSLVYVFVVGLSYTAFTGFVLDTIGKGAAATKYNAFASLSNMPITYMGLVLAWAHAKWGEHGMLYTDAAAGVLGLCVLGVSEAILAPRKMRRPESRWFLIGVEAEKAAKKPRIVRRFNLRHATRRRHRDQSGPLVIHGMVRWMRLTPAPGGDAACDDHPHAHRRDHEHHTQHNRREDGEDAPSPRRAGSRTLRRSGWRCRAWWWWRRRGLSRRR